MRRFPAFALLLALCLPAVAMPRPVQDSGEEAAVVEFKVVADTNGRPIRNASVVLHPVNKKGKQERKGQQLKTDKEGKTGYPGVPFGKVRVQVIAPGYQTYGEDYDIYAQRMVIIVRMKRPQGQYSIYGADEGRKLTGEKPPESTETKQEEPKKDEKEKKSEVPPEEPKSR